MPRKPSFQRRELTPDPKTGNVMVSRLVNSVMKQGKKSTAERIVYGALRIIEEKTGQEGLAVMRQAFNNLRPNLEVKSRRVGGATYQVPVEIKPERRTALAMRWLIGFAQSRPGSHHGREAGVGADRRLQERGRGDQEEGGYASHGGGQQGLRPLSLVSRPASGTRRRSGSGHGSGTAGRNRTVRGPGSSPRGSSQADSPSGRSARQAGIGPPAPGATSRRASPRGRRREKRRHRSGKAWDESPRLITERSWSLAPASAPGGSMVRIADNPGVFVVADGSHKRPAEHRDHGPHRCGQDDPDGAGSLLLRPAAPHGGGPRRGRHHGLDGAGAGARHHHHLRGDHHLLARPPDQHHRHPGPRRLHRGGGAQPAGPRRGRRRLLRGGRGRAAVGDGLAPGRQVQRSAHRLRQQDGPRRRRTSGAPCR